jgi:hypothetical protein
MSENLGGFRSSRVGCAEALLTFPGMGSICLSLQATHGVAQRRGVAAGKNPAASAAR